MRPFFCYKQEKQLMKKISVLMFALLCTGIIFAQQAQLGIKGGLNVSTMTNDAGYNWGSKVGFNAGLLAHIRMTPDLALQPEVQYSTQGAKYTVSDGEHSLDLNYINIPVQLQYMFRSGFRIQTGPQIGFLTNVKDELGNAETGYFTNQDFKSVDFSWSVGLGYVGYSGLGVDARYNFGLSNINNAGPAIRHNDVFQLGLLYMLRH